jgi:hypothetical protein
MAPIVNKLKKFSREEENDEGINECNEDDNVQSLLRMRDEIDKMLES